MLSTTPYWEDVGIGLELPTLRKGPMTSSHLMRWSAAIENWHKIHYDLPYATERERLPGLLINGSVKQQFVMQLLKDWAGPSGWVWKASLQFRAMNLAGETLDIWGTVTDKRRVTGFGLVDIALGIRNHHGLDSTPGRAIVALPYRGGPAVPYPFVPPV
jgi:acyl dehydratase